ncbi:hypothetical protein DFO45_2693 [Azorhizobium sp. AG788]|uniref:hypothetical protein n=1 Tax=Azorhizobium sp. AG788 TaxID=2183897 RepID=UPI00105EEF45|nr:hypothetical protein [Azorhizobium sp. AG788]TDT94935.1 hypothetical protein DFO45_2693 [Azorhizobium sp. AG788]
MTILLSFLPSWFTAALAGLSIVAGVGAVLYGLLPVAPYRRIATVAGAGLVAAGCWFSGVSAGQAQSEAAALRQQLADAKVTAAVQAAQLNALQSDSAAAAAQVSDLTKLKDAADALTSRTPDGACLPADAADGLRSLWPR